MGTQLIQLNESGGLDVASGYNMTVHPRTGTVPCAHTYARSVCRRHMREGVRTGLRKRIPVATGMLVLTGHGATLHECRTVP